MKHGGVVMAGLLMSGLAWGELLVAGFDDLLTGAGWTESYGGPGGGDYYNGSNGSGGFTSNGVSFGNAYTDWGGGYYSWTGWAYSTTTDVVTAGYDNQYSAFAGGAESGIRYAMTYAPSAINLPVGWQAPVGISVANSTYAGISMRDGDAFAKQFGAGDYFKLILTGKDSGGTELGSVEVFLADFREDTNPGYILDSWQSVDLSALGTGVVEIALSLESTDNGTYGMNTPAYVAIDNLVLGATPIPEPGSIALVFGLLGLALLTYCRRL